MIAAKEPIVESLKRLRQSNTGACDDELCALVSLETKVPAHLVAEVLADTKEPQA